MAPSRIDELKKRYEENPRRFFAPLANEYRKSGDLDQAIALCQEHLTDQPGNMNGHVVYAQSLFDAGRLDEAETAFQTALSLDPENLIALRHLGDIARSKNDAPGALAWYQRVLDADPRNDEILGFIDELKAAAPPAAPAPTPVMTPVVTPPSTPAVEAPRVSTASTPTPIAPIEAVKPPAPRPTASLLDLDFGTEPAAPPPPVEPPAAAAPAPAADDIGLDFGSVDFGSSADSLPSEPPAEPVVESYAAAVAEAPEVPEFGLVDLDAPHPSVEPPAELSTDVPAPRTSTPQAFVTESMAELYLQQGYRDEALDVYRQLLAQNPDDASLRERIAHLEKGDRASLSLEVVKEEEPDIAPGTVPLIDDFVAEPTPAVAADPAAEAMPEVPSLGEIEFPAMDEVAPIAEEVVDMAPPAPELEPEPEPAPAPVRTPARPTPAVPAFSARSFFAALSQRRATRPNGTAAVPAPPAPVASEPAPAAAPSHASGSIDALFGSSAATDADTAMASALATALSSEAPAPVRGRPTQAAQSELSLDSVFRGEGTMRTSGPVNRQSRVLKFDQFFEGGEQPAAPPQADAATPPVSPTDDAQFQSWLQGLKGQ